MAGEEVQKVKVAAIQMISQDGRVQENLQRAESFIIKAAEEGARLVVLPEFMPQGYRLTPEIWETAETLQGQTAEWLKQLARELGIYIGTSFLEYEGKDYYNTFILAAPGGEIAGWVRKRSPSIWEAYFFKGYKGKQYIDTEIGRIGVGICFDNHTDEVGKNISESNVDIILMPHSNCVPVEPNKLVTEKDIERLNGLPSMIARMYNGFFGVPVVMVNKSGAWDSPLPTNILPKMGEYSFSGRSCIIDANGEVKAELDDREGIAISEVTLDKQQKKKSELPKYSRYLYPGPAGREITRLLELMGKISYIFNKKKRLV